MCCAKLDRSTDVHVEGLKTRGAKFDWQLTRRGSPSQHLVIALALIFASLAGVVRAAVSVEVIGTDPPGATVVVPRNENFYVRLRYTRDQAISIWARPYFQGREVDAGSNPSRTYTGSGEAMGWFFFMTPGDQVDEIRITAGDRSHNGAHLVATYPARVVGGTELAQARALPDWVVELSRQHKAAQQDAYARRMNTPLTAGDAVLFDGFILTVFALGVFGFAAPAWGLWRWRGGWRIAVAIPAAMMAFVVLRIVIGVSSDPTSHDLWPFEIMQVGAVGVVIMAALVAARGFYLRT
jgi:hypothetical protein